jgi:extracellular elastinolytic metalloproteinase
MHSRHTTSRNLRRRIAGGVTVALVAASIIASTSTAPAQKDSPRADAGARVHDQERILTSKAGTSALDTVRSYLRSQGFNSATLKTVKADGRSWTYRRTTHMWLGQRVNGLRVYDAYGKAALNSKGQLVHLIENFSTVRSDTRAADTHATAALRAAVRDLYPRRSTSTKVVDRSGTTTTYASGGRFLTGPTVERVLVARKSAFAVSFAVDTWDAASNDYYESLVNGHGKVVRKELRTAQDDYDVFEENPEETPQAIVAGPGDGNDQSPIGWVFGSLQRAVNIAGNNVHAYLDVDSNNKPDAGGDFVNNQRFVTAADLDESPSTHDNQEVAIQNLFYLNNLIHDTLYIAGFTEATGNFQEENFTGAGEDSDSVNAEAQDGGGLDNANFATPPDGVNPRMQMYLWTGLGTHEVVVHTDAGDVTYLAQGAVWGAQLDTTGVTGDLALAVDGTAPTADACESLVGTYTDAIVIADRGACNFTVKAKNVQLAGGAGIIVANNVAGSPFTMGGADASVTIPAVMVSQADGTAIKAEAGTSTTIKLADTPPLLRDGDVDSDVVWHEYGHGLTWRMIGKMSGPLGGAIGEGMSDVLAIYANEDDVIGEYSASDPLGIRTVPYDVYNRTYGDIVGAEVHLDGEVYGAIGWRLLQHYQTAGIDKSVLLADLVDGMNYTPRQPTFEEMRDGILDGLAISGNDDRACLVWAAFAEYGVGVGAHAVVRGPNVAVTESFDLPAECA